ncbi:Protein PTHB1 [Schistosoma japonicum]|uniref:Protein PTHB1 n=2 Tax=Schistosoma japonicum TaxID=6182 RepID=A0A4Z2DEG7_SCHJA|nr:Protein PTHB1 [Schistosoma japonicum]
MSLFKIRDIWSSQLHKINVDDGFCLKLSPLHKLNKSQYFILFGTSFGTLYIFLPRAVNISANEKTNDQLWNYNDLCLEYNMEDPILSIDCGNLTTEICQYQQIVILHSRMVSVYNFTKSGDSFQAYNDTFSLESWKITLLFNLNLQKASYKLFLDKFFEQIETDIICVQTVDASLYFFNTTGELLQITLPDVIIPGPMIFLNSIHSLIIGASMKLDCFSIIPSNVKSSELIHCGQKNISLNWSIILEEPVFNLELIDSETSANKHFPLSYIIVLGRKRIFLISETGFLLSSRRIDIPSKQLCVYGYSEVNINSLERLPFGNMQRQVSWEPRYLVTTEKNQLLVFKGTQLLWSALLSFGTIHISMPMFTMGFDNQNKTPPVIGLNFSSGLIVVLNRNGRITLSYLGTDPSDLVVPNIMKSGQNDYNNDIDSNAIDYNLLQLNNNNFDEEMHQLNEHINQLLQIRSPSLPSSNNNSSLHEINFEKSTIPKLKTTIRLNSNPLNASVTELCFIDVDIEFPKIYSREQFHSVYLLVHSCPSIVIRPNYVEIHSNEFNNHDFVLFTHNKSHSYSCTLTCHSMNDLTDEDSETSSLLDDQPPLDMNTKTYRNDHSVPAASPSSLLSSSVNATLQIEVFLSSLYKSLDNYVNKRLELSNQIEKLTVQARHYRCVQREVLDRIKSTQPNCLNGFNELLEKDLINLMNICDLIDSLTKEYFRSGYSFILFKPAELLSMLHSTLLLDNVHIASLSTSPLTTESYEENFHVSFEQYLQAEINYLLKILQSNHINSSDEQQNSLNPYQKSLDQLSVVKCINERFFQLCQQLMSCDNEEIDRLMNILN